MPWFKELQKRGNVWKLSTEYQELSDMNVIKACHNFDSCTKSSMSIFLLTEWKTVLATDSINAPFVYVELRRVLSLDDQSWKAYILVSKNTVVRKGVTAK